MHTKEPFVKLNYVIFLSALLLFLSPSKIFSQSNAANLQIFYKLADSAASSLDQRIPASQKNVKLNLILGSAYNIFGNEIISSLNNNGRNIVNENVKDSSFAAVSFIIDNAKVTYGKLFKKSIFGEFYTTRNLILSGSYVLFSSDAKSYNFKFSYSDTITTSDLKNIENTSYPFTQGQLPAEPFFSSIYEPVIAVGTAALTVILFFTIRSK
ncbi:MAG: hypothetical protein M1480_15810 [Bacteroidetes bacterium]|nr:hypothetical protein [Bacteroidota bacterium]